MEIQFALSIEYHNVSIDGSQTKTRTRSDADRRMESMEATEATEATEKNTEVVNTEAAIVADHVTAAL